MGANVKKRKFNLRPGLLLSMEPRINICSPIILITRPKAMHWLVTRTLVRANHFSVGLMFSYIHNL